MENAMRWIFCLVMVLLLLYACTLYHNSSERLSKAEKELSVLWDTEQALREENESILERIAAAVGSDSD